MGFWSSECFDPRLGEVSCIGRQELGRSNVGGAVMESVASFEATPIAFFDLVALLKHLRVLLKVSVANFNFCASVERGPNISGVVKMTRFEGGRYLTGFARWEEVLAEDLVVGLAEPSPPRRTVELELDAGSVGSSKPSRARNSFNVRGVTVLGDLVSSLTVSASEDAGVGVIDIFQRQAVETCEFALPCWYLHQENVTLHTRDHSKHVP
jgi:hypothetical protein